MKRSKILLGAAMFLVVVLCLVSVPALSGENPWDSDGGGSGGTGSPIDTLRLDGVNLRAHLTSAPSLPGNDVLPNWISRAAVKVSFFVISQFHQVTLKKTQVFKSAY